MTDNRKQRLVAALRQSKGIVLTACQSVGVPRRTFYHWLDSDPEFRRNVEDVGEEAIDFVESKLMERIEAGAERSIIFFLKTRGKRRGYREGGSPDSDLMDLNRVLLNPALAAESAVDRLLLRLDDPEDTISEADIAEFLPRRRIR